MKLIDYYIMKAIWSAVGLMTLLLSVLQIFILFVNQLNNIGHGDFNLWEATIFVILQTPYQVYLFFPIISLLGALVGLGFLATNNELVVMRISGMSILQITGVVLQATLVLLIIATIIGELCIPRLMVYSKNRQIQALSGGQALRTINGVWLRYQNDFINIGSIQADNVLRDVLRFHFDNSYNLQFTQQVDHINYMNGVWYAYDSKTTFLHNNKIILVNDKQLVWPVVIKPVLLQLSSSEPDDMNLHELHQYIREKQHNHQLVINYQLVFWHRIFQPLATLTMVFIAAPFIFGPLRSATMGLRFMAGAGLGFGFHIFNHLFGSFSQVYQLSPIIAALIPTVIFAVIGMYLIQNSKIVV